jgi:hypothetical protein
MPISQRDFGVLTMATMHDYRKAIGLALSVRVSNPGMPIAIACSPTVAQLIGTHFDFVVHEKPGMKGFVHKVYLDEYSPFQETLFLDSDVFVFKPLRHYLSTWGDYAYRAVGVYRDKGIISAFGQDQAAVMRKIGAARLVDIGGAGHAYFRKPDSGRVFAMAREITQNYREYAGDARYADEDVMNIVMTKLELPPAPEADFLSRYCSGKPGTVEIDVTMGKCRFIDVVTGLPKEPCIMHFADNEAPFAYFVQLARLFKKFGVDRNGLLSQGVEDYFEVEIKRPMGRRMPWLKKLLAR